MLPTITHESELTGLEWGCEDRAVLGNLANFFQEEGNGREGVAEVSCPGEEESITRLFLPDCSSGTIEGQLPVLMNGKEVPPRGAQFLNRYRSTVSCSSHL